MHELGVTESIAAICLRHAQRNNAKRIVKVNVKLGDHAEALRCADQRIVLARRYGNARLESAALRQKADVLRASGKIAEAAAIQELATECERAHGAAPVI